MSWTAIDVQRALAAQNSSSSSSSSSNQSGSSSSYSSSSSSQSGSSSSSSSSNTQIYYAKPLSSSSSGSTSPKSFEQRVAEGEFTYVTAKDGSGFYARTENLGNLLAQGYNLGNPNNSISQTYNPAKVEANYELSHAQNLRYLREVSPGVYEAPTEHIASEMQKVLLAGKSAEYLTVERSGKTLNVYLKQPETSSSGKSSGSGSITSATSAPQRVYYYANIDDAKYLHNVSFPNPEDISAKTPDYVNMVPYSVKTYVAPEKQYSVEKIISSPTEIKTVYLPSSHFEKVNREYAKLKVSKYSSQLDPLFAEKQEFIIVQEHNQHEQKGFLQGIYDSMIKSTIDTGEMVFIKSPELFATSGGYAIAGALSFSLGNLQGASYYFSKANEQTNLWLKSGQHNQYIREMTLLREYINQGELLPATLSIGSMFVDAYASTSLVGGTAKFGMAGIVAIQQIPQIAFKEIPITAIKKTAPYLIGAGVLTGVEKVLNPKIDLGYAYGKNIYELYKFGKVFELTDVGLSKLPLFSSSLSSSLAQTSVLMNKAFISGAVGGSILSWEKTQEYPTQVRVESAVVSGALAGTLSAVLVPTMNAISKRVEMNFIEETQVYFPKEKYISQFPTSKGLQKGITPHFYYSKGEWKTVSHLPQEWVKETFTIHPGIGLHLKINGKTLFDFHLYSYSPEAVFGAKTPVVFKPLSPLATTSTLSRLDKVKPALAQDIRTMIFSAESIRAIDLKLPDNAVSKRLDTYFSSEKFSKFTPKQQKAMSEAMFDFIRGKPDFYRTAEGQIYGSQHLSMYSKDIKIIGREAGDIDIQFWSYTSPSGKAEQLVNMLKPHGIKAKVIEGTQVGVVSGKEVIKIADIHTLYSPAEIESIYAGWGIKNPTSLKLHFEKDVAFPFFKFGEEASVKGATFVLSNMQLTPKPKREKDIGDYYGVLKFLSRSEPAQEAISKQFGVSGKTGEVYNPFKSDLYVLSYNVKPTAFSSSPTLISKTSTSIPTTIKTASLVPSPKSSTITIPVISPPSQIQSTKSISQIAQISYSPSTRSVYSMSSKSLTSKSVYSIFSYISSPSPSRSPSISPSYSPSPSPSPSPSLSPSIYSPFSPSPSPSKSPSPSQSYFIISPPIKNPALFLSSFGLIPPIQKIQLAKSPKLQAKWEKSLTGVVLNIKRVSPPRIYFGLAVR